MGEIYDEKIAIELLTEIALKSDGEKPVELDLTDPARMFNLKLLESRGGLLAYDGIPIRNLEEDFKERHIMGVTIQGMDYLAELRRSYSQFELADAMLATEKQKLAWDRIAVVVSVFALVISILGFFRTHDLQSVDRGRIQDNRRDVLQVDPGTSFHSSTPEDRERNHESTGEFPVQAE